MATFLYFAYGSNMLTSRLREGTRCPTARLVGTATLRDYILKWHKRGKDGSGKCDVVASEDGIARVYGVLFEIDEKEKAALDRAEGFGHGYDRADFTVLLNGQSVRAMAYIATNIDASLKPLDSYRDYVVKGAIEHGLPEAYIATLKAVETMQAVDDTK
jgi:gamma-glutamylcyclotransferase